jgi:preprotein translocase SecE subunit
MFAFWALFLLVAFGCFHGGGLSDLVAAWIGDSDQTYVDPFPILGTLKTSTCIALGAWLVIGFCISRILNRKRIANALIDTEAEMKKVTWPTWTETWHGTIAVAAMVVVMFIYLFVVDLGLARAMMLLLGGGQA